MEQDINKTEGELDNTSTETSTDQTDVNESEMLTLKEENDALKEKELEYKKQLAIKERLLNKNNTKSEDKGDSKDRWALLDFAEDNNITNQEAKFLFENLKSPDLNNPIHKATLDSYRKEKSIQNAKINGTKGENQSSGKSFYQKSEQDRNRDWQSRNFFK